jgi:hypothetical protein
MIRLELKGPHTLLLSSLCARCPQGPTGCCAAPPELDWSDIGRVVALGGRAFLLAQIAAKNLVPAARGLALRRVRTRASSTEPRRARCVFHGPTGCTIAHDLRPATCNYFLCDDAYAERDEAGRADPAAPEARRAHEALKRLYEGWDRDLEALVAATWPEGPPWDEAFLDWLGAEMDRRMREAPPSQVS